MTPLHEQGRVPPKLDYYDSGALYIRGTEDQHHAIRIRLNRARPAHVTRSRLGQHTRDCRDPKVRARFARTYQTQNQGE